MARPRYTALLRLTTALSIVLCFMASTAANAQSGAAEAEQLFRDGKRLMQEKKFAEACSAFETSHKIDPALTTKLNLADCREKNNQFATAWGLFVDAERETRGNAKQAGLNKTAKTRADGLEKRLSYLTISVADESRIEGLIVLRNGVILEEGLWNRAVPVDGGETVIAGQAPGHEEWSTTTSVPFEGGKVSVEVPRFKELKKLVPTDLASPDSEDRSGTDPGKQPAASPSTFTGSRKLALVLGGAGLVGLVGGVVLGIQASGLEDDAYAICPSSPCDDANAANDLVADAERRALFANISYGVGAAAIVGAAILWFTGAPSDESARTTVAPHISPAFTGIAVSGRF